jgi:WD40 repeat protein
LTAEVALPGDVHAGAWSPDDQLLASGHGDGTVTVSGTHAGDKIVTLRGHVQEINRVVWSPDRTRLASASHDFTARIWDVALGKMVLGPLQHSHVITALAWEPDGQRLATGSADETVKIWNATTGRAVVTLRGHFQCITSLSWGPGDRLASGCLDGSMRIWTANRAQESSVLPGHDVGVRSVSWSPDGKRLASSSYDGMVRIWNLVTREEVLTLKGHEERRVNQDEILGLQCRLAWSPDGTHLATAGLDGTAKVWETASGREVFAFPAGHGMVCSVGWNPDGSHLAAGATDGTIHVVEGLKETPKVHLFKAHPGGYVRCVAWSPQGDRLASGGSDALVKVWNPLSGVELAHLRGHQYPLVLGVAWSPDGKRLASAAGDRFVMVWDAETGRDIWTMRGHTAFVDGVVWRPDGTRLASAGFDNSVRVWDPRTGEETLVLRGDSARVWDVSWHPDGAELAAASNDGQIWIWDATRGFERDTTPRALPYIDRAVASGTARGEDLLWYAQSYFRARKLREALGAVKGNPSGLYKLSGQFAERGNGPLADEARTKARSLLEQQRAAEPDNAAAAAELADLLLIDSPAQWTILKPVEAKSEPGATLSILPDHSILASGASPMNDRYRVVLTVATDIDLTAIRLEALTHHSLPGNGPGRTPTGSFAQTSWNVTAASRDRKDPIGLQFDNACSDHEIPGYPMTSSGHWNIAASG